MMPTYEIGVRICLGWLMSHNIIKLQSVDFSTQGYRPLYIQGYKVV
ncbi:hypothetical protein [Shewanella sp. NFH-SH190041]|nr:hypothetical protein [Shewanella sp. NFH-SH190041]